MKALVLALALVSISGTAHANRLIQGDAAERLYADIEGFAKVVAEETTPLERVIESNTAKCHRITVLRNESLRPYQYWCEVK